MSMQRRLANLERAAAERRLRESRPAAPSPLDDPAWVREFARLVTAGYAARCGPRPGEGRAATRERVAAELAAWWELCPGHRPATGAEAERRVKAEVDRLMGAGVESEVL